MLAGMSLAPVLLFISFVEFFKNAVKYLEIFAIGVLIKFWNPFNILVNIARCPIPPT